MPSDNKELKEENRDVPKKGIAMEILQEKKAQARIWMIAFFIVFALWIGTVEIFVRFINQ